MIIIIIMINDDEHDDDHDDDVMHDMHTNTMHHAWCNVCHKGNATHKRTKMHKNKRNVTKTCKNIQRRETTMAFKKTMATK